MSKPKTVSDYIKTYPKLAQKRLKEMRSIIRKAAPKATENLKWGSPSVSYKRILVTYGAYKNHVSLFPTPSPIRKYAKELSKFETSKGTIKFPLDKALPASLIRKIVAFRVKESLEKDVKWMPK